MYITSSIRFWLIILATHIEEKKGTTLTIKSKNLIELKKRPIFSNSKYQQRKNTQYRFLQISGWTDIKAGYWGDWKDPVEGGLGYYACGADSHDPTVSTSSFPSNIRSVSPSNDPTEAYSQNSGWTDIKAGYWGDWKDPVEGGLGYYACGADMRFEDDHDGDETAGNGLKLIFCHYNDWSRTTGFKEIFPGIWGNWKGEKMCPENMYIDGAKVRFEDTQESDSTFNNTETTDETALNGLHIRCSTKDGMSNSWVSVYDGLLGQWYSEVIKPGNFVTGARIQFQDYLGPSVDDTAWNGLRFKFEPMPSDILSASPSNIPSVSPSHDPTVRPSSFPSNIPSVSPSHGPTVGPSSFPSNIPSVSPSHDPTVSITSSPSNIPSVSPSNDPT
eukprot:CAMPEP_0172518646 /NCGR_PEP_ID=MMETSP1066-20121228/290942_1 /TAXON_ID=671091 /ORGANISM="Coscinodiscus wailesii, Strain CCMP2513" /LENGTH=386 /DNA_ID=CAMNT_0013301075 /DNA_START=153 /DNA_END=1311 /DNA_ORIENTATION=+